MRKALVMTISLLLLGTSYAQAKDMVTDTVKVTATKVEKEIKDVPYTVNVITSDEIASSGATSIAELVKDIPGIQITSTGAAGIFRLNMRGESGSRALIMVDGMKISEQKSMDGAPLLIDPNTIERIEVIKGPASILYGSEAIGGVVNIITKKGGKKPIQGTLSALYDSSNSSYSTSASIYGDYNGFYYRLEGTKTDAGKRIDSDGDTLDNTEYDNSNVSILTGYQNDKFDIAASYSKFDSNNDVYISEDSISAPLTAMYMELPEWSREKTDLKLELKKVSKYIPSIKMVAYKQKTFKEFVNNMDMEVFIPFPPPGSTMAMEYRSNTQNDLETIGTNLQFDIAPADNSLILVGFEYFKDDLTADEDKRTFGATTSTLYTSEAEQQTLAAFINAEQVIADSFILNAGLRYTKVESELTSTNNPSFTEEKTDSADTVGSVSLVYNGIKNISIRSIYAKGFRVPNLQQLFMGTTHGSTGATYSNPDLDEETSNNFEVGARYTTKQINIDIAVFHNQAKNYITTKQLDDGTDDREYTNIDKATTTGVEVMTSLTFGKFTPYVNGAYITRKYEYEDFSTTKNGMPNLTSRFGLRYNDKLGQQFYLNTDIFARYAGEAKEEASDGDIDKTDGYTTINASISGVYQFQDYRKITVTLEGINLGNEDYELALSSIPEPGRYFRFKTSIDF